MPKAGDVVLYRIQGNEHNAIVLHVNGNQPDHLGANGEPLLHLGFIAPERESEITKKKFAYLPEIFIEYDVVHSSHVFSDAYKRAHGLFTPAQIANERGGGEWSETAPGTPEVEAAVNQQKLRAFLLENFKSDTGDETPEACAIRLLGRLRAPKK